MQNSRRLALYHYWVAFAVFLPAVVLGAFGLSSPLLAKVTPELEAYCEGLWQKYKLHDAVPYDPWQVGQDIVVFPGAQGGKSDPDKKS